MIKELEKLLILIKEEKTALNQVATIPELTKMIFALDTAIEILKKNEGSRN